MLYTPFWLTLSFTWTLNKTTPVHPSTEYISAIGSRKFERQFQKLERTFDQAEYEKALEQAETLYEETKDSFPPDHPMVLELEYYLATLYFIFEEYERTIPLLHSLYLTYQDIDATKSVDILSQLSNVYYENNEFQMAHKHYEMTYQLYLENNDPLDPVVLETMGALGYIKSKVGLMSESIQTLEYVLKHQQESTDISYTSESLTRSDLISVYQAAGDYQQAHTLLVEQLASDLKHLGENSEDTLYTRYQLAKNSFYRGDIRTSKSQYLDLLHQQTSLFGEQSWQSLRTLNDLSIIYADSGDLIEAEQIMQRIIRQRILLFGADHYSIRAAQHNLASIYIDLKRYDKAQEILMAIIEDPLATSDDILLAESTLSTSFQEQGRLEEALDIRKRLLSTQQHTLGNTHPKTVLALNNLAITYEDLGNIDTAEEMYRQALKINRDELGPFHPRTLSAMNNLAVLYSENGNFETAETLLLQALDGYKEVLENETTSIIDITSNLASLYQSSGDYDKAFQYMQQSVLHLQKFLSKNLFGSEHERQTFLINTSGTHNFLYGLFFDNLLNNPDALQFTLTTWINNKGLLFESSKQTLNFVEKEDETEITSWKTQLEDLQHEQARLVSMTQSDEVIQSLNTINDQIDALEQDLSLKNRSMNTKIQHNQISDLIETLPTDGILFDFIIYNAIEDGEPNIGVFIIAKDGSVSAHSIGTVQTFQRKLHAFRQTRNARLGASLYEMIFTQNNISIPQNAHIIFSTDGILNSIPLGLLQDSTGEMLIEKGPISYISAGRDLINLIPSQVKLGESPFVLANPTFNPKDSLSDLPNTVNEAELLKDIFEKTTMYLGSDATIQNLKNLNNPSLLHLATHGFYEPNTININPMTQSGLELAYNPMSEGESSRILASEMTHLKLKDTKLVVLSACESGLGTSLNGDGVYGLRRSLRLAGAQSLLISLWPVNDDATAVFMKIFYSAINSGLSLKDALRTTKLSMKQSEEWSNPVHWAAFILEGYWE